MPQLLIVVQVFLAALTQIEASHCQADTCTNVNSPQGDRIPGHVITGHLIAKVTSTSHAECHARCMLDCACLSINTKDSGTECELNYGSNTTSPEFLTKRTGWTNQRMVFDHPKQPECQNFCCLTSPCKDGVACRETCDSERRFECLCPLWLTGVLCERYNYCWNVTCQNNGTCVNNATGATCNCLPYHSGKHCEIKKLVIEMESFGLDDPGYDDINRALIQVNGVKLNTQVKPHGHEVVVLDPRGKFKYYRCFDTHGSYSDGKAMNDVLLNDVSTGDIVLVAVADSGEAYISPAYAGMRTVNCGNSPLKLYYRYTYVLVGAKNLCPSWHFEKSSMRRYGPTKHKTTIILNN